MPHFLPTQSAGKAVSLQKKARPHNRAPICTDRGQLRRRVLHGAAGRTLIGISDHGSNNFSCLPHRRFLRLFFISLLGQQAAIPTHYTHKHENLQQL